MRKITEDAIQAFRNGKKFKRGNTEVKWGQGLRTYLLLHGNIIAEKDIFGNLSITTAGWQTTTTKERLNGFPNVHIVQKNFQWFLNGEAWNGQEIKVE